MKSKDVKSLKQILLEKQEYRCAICGKELTLENSVLDHQHKNRKTDPNGINGDGLVRGVLCQEDNLTEGKIWNATKRFQGARTVQDRIIWLQKLIKYYQQDPYPYIHPTEVKKEPDLSKKNFNKLAKLYKEKYPKKKPLEYPKSKKMTKSLKLLYKEFDINPFNM